MSIRDAFKAAPGPTREAVEVPALGLTVYVRQVTAGERDDFEYTLRGLKAKDRRPRARIAILVTVEEDGTPAFGPDDVEWLSGLPANYLEPILDANMRLNALSRRDQDALEKN